jgi:hypothetical protein
MTESTCGRIYKLSGDYDVSSDGQRSVISNLILSLQIVLAPEVLNWFQELKQHFGGAK